MGRLPNMNRQIRTAGDVCPLARVAADILAPVAVSIVVAVQKDNAASGHDGLIVEVE